MDGLVSCKICQSAAQAGIVGSDGSVTNGYAYAQCRACKVVIKLDPGDVNVYPTVKGETGWDIHARQLSACSDEVVRRWNLLNG